MGKYGEDGGLPRRKHFRCLDNCSRSVVTVDVAPAVPLANVAVRPNGEEDKRKNNDHKDYLAATGRAVTPPYPDQQHRYPNQRTLNEQLH